MSQERIEKQKYTRKDAPPKPVGRRPWIRVDGASITRRDDKDQPYQVRIIGHNLFGSIVQPIITVGALPLENVRFVGDGKAIEGTLSREPGGGRVVVDYDVTRSETELTWGTESSDKTAS
jgi:hypothetical protein